MVKSYNLTFDYVLYKMSFANVRMYNAVIPTYSPTKDKKDTEEEAKVISGDDPTNRSEISKAMFDVNEDE